MKIIQTGEVDTKIRGYAKKYHGTTHLLRENISCGCKGWSNLGTLTTTLNEKERKSLKLKTILKVIFSFGIALAFKNVRLNREAAKTGVLVDSLYTLNPIANPVSERLKALFPEHPNQAAAEVRMGTVGFSHSSSLPNFYRNQSRNSSNLYLRDIWNLSLKAKESNHDYIQWLFPTFQPSQFNAQAPLLTPRIIAEMRRDPAIKENIRHSFNVMLEFYGLTPIDARTIVKSEKFNERAKVWLLDPRGHHNFLRITRILTCLNLMGLNQEAQAFLEVLEEIAEHYPEIITQETLDYWKGAHSS